MQAPLDILHVVAQELAIPQVKVKHTVELLDAGNTVPFIARYRKEATGELDETQIRRIEELVGFYRNLEQRKAEVMRLIDEQGLLTDELRARIMGAHKLAQLEDLYRPYRPKRRTRAGVARERGLEPLANYMLAFPSTGNPLDEANNYLTEDVPTAEEALQGAMDIVAELVADDPDSRGWIRDYTWRHGKLVTSAKDADAESVYQLYYDFSEPLRQLVPHRVLAINRGEREEFLKVAVQVEERAILDWLERRFVKLKAVTTDLVRGAVVDAYKRLIAPAVERDLRHELTEKAQAQAIVVFARNLRSLLLQPPMPGKVVLGIDPAFRTGCKWAVVSETSQLLATGVIYPTPPQNKVAEAERILQEVITRHNVQIITIGNGTASRETEIFVAALLSKLNRPGLAYSIVNEAGASVYSASPLAAKELPQLDVSERGAVSIARRLQDPLAELVKIEPKSIGVGQYQHDVAAKQLDTSLTGVVESAVNYVGVDVNTASPALLQYVAGINTTVAGNIVAFREQEGKFKDRARLKKVPRLGPKTFEQCIGFLRISGGQNPLDNTPIHPESYAVTKKLLDFLGAKPSMLGQPELRAKLARLDLAKVADELEVGIPTLRDILDSLARPGRDPREELPPPVLRTDVLSIEDLKPGMLLKGTVRNVVDFGAFVDIGVKNDGLVHVSEMADDYVRHPLDHVAVGDVVNVRVLTVDAERGRISLSLKNGG